MKLKDDRCILSVELPIMDNYPGFKFTPWNSKVFGIDAFEIDSVSVDSLERAKTMLGHHTIRVHPTTSKKLLHEYGFYYCDTLVEPFCAKLNFRAFESESVEMVHDVPIDLLIEICHGAFDYDHFHRDFNLLRELSDIRFDNWLSQLYFEGKVFGLLFQKELVGFVALQENCLALHAISLSKRGKGLAKFLWTPVCREIFDSGYKEVISSVSASNLAVVNLYSTLGFKFRNPVDIYHRFNR